MLLPSPTPIRYIKHCQHSPHKLGIAIYSAFLIIEYKWNRKWFHIFQAALLYCIMSREGLLTLRNVQLSGRNSSEMKGSCFVCYFPESPSLVLSIRAIALGDWAFYLFAASSHLPWKSRLFPPYASMFCQASPVCSALSKFHYGMAWSAQCCSLRLSAWHVTVCNTRDAGGLIPPA